MKKTKLYRTGLLACLLTASFTMAQAQAPVASGKTTGDHEAQAGEFQLTNLLAQSRSRERGGFNLMPASYSMNRGRAAFTLTPMAAGPNLAVQGSGTIGRLAKWTGLTSSNSFLGDSTIFESKTGLVGIGTDAPTSKLTIQGMVETTLGGYKFPDGTVQTTSAAGALFTVAHDATLKGNGTAASPLGVAVPLHLTGSEVGILLSATNNSGPAIGGNSTNSFGVAGSSTFGDGVFGFSNFSGNGVRGFSGSGSGVDGISESGNGVHGQSVTGNGVEGKSTDSAGVRGEGRTGVVAIGSSVIGGVAGFGLTANGGDAVGGAGGAAILAKGGKTFNNGGFPAGGQGVQAVGGDAQNGSGGRGVGAVGGEGNGLGNVSGNGIEAFPGLVSGGATAGLAARLLGDVEISGKLLVTSGIKMFHIDHPLDPENKYLNHAAIESSEVLNVYSGNVTTNEQGDAVVRLPEWFEALNKDFRYQLTVLGTFAQAIVADEVKNNRFLIKTNAANVKVSWQVTGVRSDATARKYQFEIEEAKPERERGYYLNPDAFGQAEEKSIEWIRNPEMMQRLKQQRLEAEEKGKKQGANDR